MQQLTSARIGEILANPTFKELASKRARLRWGLSLLTLLMYFGFIVLISTAGSALGRNVPGTAIPIGLLLALIMEYFNQALQLDPSYALAYCGLADNYGWMGGLLPGKELWAREKEMAQKALALDPNYQDALHGLGMALFNRGRVDEAIVVAKKLIELDKDDILAHTSLSMFYQSQGRIEEAEKEGNAARILGWKQELRGG